MTWWELMCWLLPLVWFLKIYAMRIDPVAGETAFLAVWGVSWRNNHLGILGCRWCSPWRKVCKLQSLCLWLCGWLDLPAYCRNWQWYPGLFPYRDPAGYGQSSVLVQTNLWVWGRRDLCILGQGKTVGFYSGKYNSHGILEQSGIWCGQRKLRVDRKKHLKKRGCAMYDAFHPGQIWLDTEGKRIHAHGGSVIYIDGTYYWYGENKEKTTGDNDIWTWGVRCYASVQLGG